MMRTFALVFAASAAAFAEEPAAATAPEQADPARAAGPATPAPEAEPAASAGGWEEKVNALLEEVRALKLEIAAPAAEYQSYAGMGPAASKVYFAPRGLSIGGYGEVTFAAPFGGQATSDLQRLILYTGYRFADFVVFNAEIEYEHAHTAKRGEVEVEFAYLDFLISPFFNVRAGNLLVPMGMINEVHEPVFFHGTQRPDVERLLLPATWNENALGIYGQAGPVDYKVYLMNGLQAVGDGCLRDAAKNGAACSGPVKGFTSGSWAREGRQRGSKAWSGDFAGVAAVGLPRLLPGLDLGASFYAGRSGQGAYLGDQLITALVLMGEAHASYKLAGFETRALAAFGSLEQAELVSDKQGATIASGVVGGYVEAGYDVAALLFSAAGQALVPYARLERYDLNGRVPAGRTRSAKLDLTGLTAGLTYRPHPLVVLKGDYQIRLDAAGAASQTVNAGVGFVF
jgi:hypothetical protein